MKAAIDLNNLMMSKEDTIQAIINSVDELRFINSVEEGDVYAERIWDGYVDECNTQKRLMTVDEFVDDMYNSIGWDWVLDNE